MSIQYLDPSFMVFIYNKLCKSFIGSPAVVGQVLKIGSVRPSVCPAACPSVLPSVRAFSGNYIISFFIFWHDARNLYEVVRDSWIFWEIFF